VGFRVFEYRKDNKNLLVTPESTARFVRINVDEVSGGPALGQGPSHDLGIEGFLVLQGQAEFWIEGETQVLGLGQACFTSVDEVHTVRNVGDESVILHLSVIPHIQPTHTTWDDEGERGAPLFNTSAIYDVPPDRETPTEELLERHLAAFDDLAEHMEAAARDVHRVPGEGFKCLGTG